MGEQVGGYMTTFTGRRFRHAALSPDAICIEDIAHALSNLCHWGGHSSEFFSVAQHSVLVSLICPPEMAPWGLLHDAAEAYYGDMTRPLKVLLPEYKAMEEEGMRAIASALNLPWPEPPELKPFDNMALALEARRFMHPGALHDGHGNGIDVGDLPQWIDLTPLSPRAAKEAFLARYHALADADIDVCVECGEADDAECATCPNCGEDRVEPRSMHAARHQIAEPSHAD